jgi:hypothetical protein
MANPEQETFVLSQGDRFDPQTGEIIEKAPDNFSLSESGNEFPGVATWDDERRRLDVKDKKRKMLAEIKRGTVLMKENGEPLTEADVEMMSPEEVLAYPPELDNGTKSH